MLKLIRLYFKILSLISPTLAANSAFKVFQKIKIKNIRDREKPFYEQAKHFVVQREEENIDAYELGNPNGRLVFLVHGWESNAGCLLKFAEELSALDYRVVAFNLPGHAFYQNSSTNLLDCKLAFELVLKQIDPQESFDVVSHSFGSAVVANTLGNTDYKVGQMVFLTNPNKIENIFRQFQDIINLGENALQKLLLKVNELLGDELATMDVENQLNKMNFNNFLMVHDENDKVLPFSNSVEINESVKGSKLHSLTDVGHYRMLWNEVVIKKVIGFVKEPISQ